MGFEEKDEEFDELVENAEHDSSDISTIEPELSLVDDPALDNNDEEDVPVVEEQEEQASDSDIPGWKTIYEDTLEKGIYFADVFPNQDYRIYKDGYLFLTNNRIVKLSDISKVSIMIPEENRALVSVHRIGKVG